MKFYWALSIFYIIFLVPSVLTAADDSTEQLLSDTSSNTTSSEEVIVEEHDEDSNVTFTSTKNPGSSGTTRSSRIPVTSTIVTSTTKKSGKPRAPSFAGWWFLIGLIVAVLFIGIAVFVFKLVCERRRPGNNVPYTAYQ